jgi:hypothetical protein
MHYAMLNNWKVCFFPFEGLIIPLGDICYSYWRSVGFFIGGVGFNSLEGLVLSLEGLVPSHWRDWFFRLEGLIFPLDGLVLPI